MINIDLVAENLFNLKSDVCVSIIHRSGNLRKGPFSKQILEAAGDKLQTEINARAEHLGREFQQGEVVRTKPHGLANNFKCLYFVCLKRWQEGNDADLQTAVDWILKDAEKRRFTLLTFPPLGTGGQGYPPIPVALAILQAVIAYSLDNRGTNITTVKITLFQQRNEMLEAFTDILEEGMSIVEQGEMGAAANQPQNDDKCQNTIFARLIGKRNFFQTIASFFGRPPPILFFQIGPVNIGVGPYLNIKPQGLGLDVTIGFTVSTTLLPSALLRRLNK